MTAPKSSPVNGKKWVIALIGGLGLLLGIAFGAGATTGTFTGHTTDESIHEEADVKDARINEMIDRRFDREVLPRLKAIEEETKETNLKLDQLIQQSP